jgi:hypothetical protein
VSVGGLAGLTNGQVTLVVVQGRLGSMTFFAPPAKSLRFLLGMVAEATILLKARIGLDQAGYGVW